MAVGIELTFRNDEYLQKANIPVNLQIIEDLLEPGSVKEFREPNSALIDDL